MWSAVVSPDLADRPDSCPWLCRRIFLGWQYAPSPSNARQDRHPDRPSLPRNTYP